MKPLSKVKELLGSRVGARRRARAGTAGTGAAAAAIRPERIHPNVVSILQRLQARGYRALLVGGAVRDLLLGRTPKDFDLVTDARPEQIKRMFDNARIIGRRFRLVHLEFPGMTVEVSTFRAPAGQKRGGMIMRDNVYGTPEEDAFRRDFTVNALTYDLAAGRVIDHVGGLPDIQAGVIRTIAPARVSLREDPVRMLRAVRFQVRLGFALDPELAGAMNRMAPELARAKRHRLAEETQRFLSGGNAQAIFTALEPFGLLGPMLGVGAHSWLFQERAVTEPLPLLLPYLEALDEWVAAERAAVPPTVSLTGLLLALAEPESRALLLGQQPAHGRAAQRLKSLRHRLDGMLGNWGLLKGQVEPAQQILAAARALPVWKTEGGARPAGRGPAGTREAWMLATLLRGVAGLPEALAAQAEGAMAGLPALPIFDHLPAGRTARAEPGSRRRGGRPTRGQAAADPSAAGSRHRRRTKKKPRPKAAASP